MALHHFISNITALVFALVLIASVELSASHVLKGSVSCLDCKLGYDLSDIKVVVKCSQAKKMAMATTGEDGTFQTDLPSDAASPSNCLTKIAGGPSQLYVSRKNMVSTTVTNPKTDSYSISSPLMFYTSCLSASKEAGNCGAAKNKGVGSSKTINLPLPPEWGLAPSSYYVPFIPIIGIP